MRPEVVPVRLRAYNRAMGRRFEYDHLVFDGIIAKAHKVGLRMDDGRIVPRDYIRYPGAAVVLPVLGDGRFAFINNYRFAVDEVLYELPAGCLGEGEDPAACAARELTEETGYSAGNLRKLGGFYTGPGVSDEYIHAFLATELTEGRQKLERYERITVDLLEEAQVRSMVARGKIKDAKTIATLALYWLSKDL